MTRPDPKVSELRRLTALVGDHPQVLLVHVDDVPEIVEAYIKLHHDPGINPHNGMKTVPLESITCSKLGPAGPYWWMRRDLGVTRNPQSVGPVYFDSDLSEEVLFRKPAENVS